jgi:hypothetical protein
LHPTQLLKAETQPPLKFSDKLQPVGVVSHANQNISQMSVDIEESLSLFSLKRTAFISGWFDNACLTSASEMTASFAVKQSLFTIFSNCRTFPGQV